MNPSLQLWHEIKAYRLKLEIYSSQEGFRKSDELMTRFRIMESILMRMELNWMRGV